jgi:hypothetical protein
MGKDEESLDEVLANLGKAVEANEGRWSTIFEDKHWNASQDAKTGKIILKDTSGTTWSELSSSDEKPRVFWSENDQLCDDARWLQVHSDLSTALRARSTVPEEKTTEDYSFLNNKKDRFKEATRMKWERNGDPED